MCDVGSDKVIHLTLLRSKVINGSLGVGLNEVIKLF